MHADSSQLRRCRRLHCRGHRNENRWERHKDIGQPHILTCGKRHKKFYPSSNYAHNISINKEETFLKTAGYPPVTEP